MTVLAQLMSTEARACRRWCCLRGGCTWAGRWCWPRLAAGIGRWLGLSRAAQLGLAAALGLWTCVPGPYAPGHWLGLAFQAPSISLVVLCAWSFYRSFAPSPALRRQELPAERTLALAGILLGWVLLLDTLAVLPVALYAWGFSPAIPALALLAVLLPWVLRKGTVAMAPAVVLLVIAVLAYVVLRLPSGNAWDALLDPGCGWRCIMAIRSWRARSGSIPS